MTTLVDPAGRVLSNVGEPVIRRDTDFPDSFFDQVRDMRAGQNEKFAPDIEHVARIPVDTVHIWRQRGIDFDNMSAKEVLALLRKEGLDDFITTERRW